MYFVKKFTSGGGDNDPRQRTNARFVCETCGAKEDVNVTGRVLTFQYHVPIKCPVCHSFGKRDRILCIEKEIEKLILSKKDIDSKIELFTKEMVEIETSLITASPAPTEVPVGSPQ